MVAPRPTGGLEGVQAAMGWYRRYPEHCAGDPRPATAEKGRILFESRVADFVRILGEVKADDAVPGAYAEFNERIYRR